MNSVPTVFLVDENEALRDAIAVMLHDTGFRVETFSDALGFLKQYQAVENACVIVNSTTSNLSGAEFLQRLRADRQELPVILISRDEAISLASQVIGAGNVEFVRKPVCCEDLLATIGRAVSTKIAPQASLQLTPRQLQILDLILAGHSNKKIAAELGLSQRTVEAHRAEIMNKAGADNSSTLVRKTLCSRCNRKSRGVQV